MPDYSFSPYLTKNITSKSRKTGWNTILLLVIFLSVVFSLGIRKSIQLLSARTNLATHLTIPTNKPPETTAPPKVAKIANHAEFIQKLEKEINADGGTYSIYIYDIKRQQGFGVNEKMVITAASVNKIPILASLYYLAGKGKINLEKIIVPQKEDIQDYGTGSIRYDPTGTPYSIKTLARLMMEKSDNTAAYILATLVIGMDEIQDLLNSWGLTQTDMEDNKTSAYDMATLLIKMYQGEVTTKALTAEMLDFMDKSDFDDRIPAELPTGTKVYHKTGDEVGKSHDAAIVEPPTGNPYYLGIFTMDMTSDEATKKTEAKISKLVYEYMEKL
jgi:beta-lactamase class A